MQAETNFKVNASLEITSQKLTGSPKTVTYNYSPKVLSLKQSLNNSPPIKPLSLESVSSSTSSAMEKPKLSLHKSYKAAF
mmetsp:Transcript_33029/g.29934  ORF Transcript_33029/g.29934 Transcript_33029/m.29934 type:complete len:80 (+) Transcript_33029:181-420(+)